MRTAHAQEVAHSHQAEIDLLTKRIVDLQLTQPDQRVNSGDFALKIQGAFKKDQQAAGINWYFSAVGVQAISLHGQHTEELRNYLDRYLANATGPGGSVNDYEDVLSEIKTSPVADSDDSYAASLLVLASQYAREGGKDGQIWFTSKLLRIKQIAEANILDAVDCTTNLTNTYNSTDGRTQSLPSGKEQYQGIQQFMDNCQVVRGLLDFSKQLDPADNDKARYERAAHKISAGLQKQYDPLNNCFKFRTKISANDSDQNRFYPGRLCQIFPEAYDITLVNDKKNDVTKAEYASGWSYLQARGDKWWKGDILDDSVRIDKDTSSDNFPHMIIGYVAAKRGSYSLAESQLAYFCNELKSSTKHPDFANIEELGWALLTAQWLTDHIK